MNIIGYVAFIALQLIAPFFYNKPLARLLGAFFLSPTGISFAIPGMGGVISAGIALLELGVVVLMFPVNPWACFGIFAVLRVVSFPYLVNPITQIVTSLIVFSVVLALFTM